MVAWASRSLAGEIRMVAWASRSPSCGATRGRTGCQAWLESEGVDVGVRFAWAPSPSGDHDIDCKIDGIGAMQLKSEFVRKA